MTVEGGPGSLCFFKIWIAAQLAVLVFDKFFDEFFDEFIQKNFDKFLGQFFEKNFDWWILNFEDFFYI